VFWKLNGHHSLDDFNNAANLPQDDQVQIYTWKDATLREITELIQQVVPESASEHVTLEFHAIYISLKFGRANVISIVQQY
jgi:histone deacetylase complex subunit SAP18